MTKNKQFYKNFFRICIALVLQNIITLSVNLADNVMLGNYSEAALSGATAVNQIQFIYQQLLLGIGDSLVIFGSQYWGQRKTKEIKQYAAIAMLFSLCILAIFFITSSALPNALLHVFTDDAAIVEQGVAYLSTIRFTYIFFCFTALLLALLRSIEIVKIAFYLSVSSLILNCGINWVLIYGRYGFPELGIRGAAIGTLVARITELIFLIAYLVFKEKTLCIKIKDFFTFNQEIFCSYFKISLPIILASALWGVNTAAQTAILGHMSSNAIAANSVASNLFLLVKTAAVGAASSAAIIMGKAIGAGRKDLLKEYAHTLQILFVGIGIFCSIILFILIDPVLSLYNLSPASKELARAFLYVLTATVLVTAYQMPTNIGILRGSGNTRYMMMLDFISIYLIVLPLSFFVAFFTEASPVVVIICLNIDQFFKCIPAFIKTNYTNFAKSLTK
ncbi:MAG: MATE family efflux transporter [Faecalibacterium sp.]